MLEQSQRRSISITYSYDKAFGSRVREQCCTLPIDHVSNNTLMDPLIPSLVWLVGVYLAFFSMTHCCTIPR